MTDLLTELLVHGDYVISRLDQRLEGMTDDEHQWKPEADSWTVLPDRSVEHSRVPRPDPAPLTTIAWRLWHIGGECLGGFAFRAFGVDCVGIGHDEWWPDAAGSRDALRRSWHGFREALVDVGDAKMHEQLGHAFGPWATSSYAALVLHVLDEVIHHGAEVGMLRDLYRIRA